MQNQSLVKKFLISGAVFAAALGLIAAVMVAMTGTAAETGERLDTRQFPLLERAHRLKLATVQVQQYFTDAAATRGQDGLDDGLRQAETQAQLFRSTVDELAALDPDRAVRYRAMLPDFDAYYAAGRRMAEAYTGSGTAAGNALMAEFDRTADRLAAQVDPFLAAEQQASHELLQSQANTLNAMRNVIFGVLLVLAPVMGFTALAMLKALRRLPLVEAELRRIAAGDLRGAPLADGGKDEVSAICAGLNAMKSQLQGIMQELTASATQLAAAVQQMGAVSQAANVALDEQQSEVNQVATAMTEMSATAHEVARSAGGAAGSAQEADKASLQGRQAMEDLIAATRALTDDVMRGAELITKLEQESDQIGGIVEVIRAIAEQTNLLALNAAIEAARAGEQGRGFAVVADEVRTLAQRTARSTSEIQEMIKRLQEGAGKAVAAMEQGRQRSEHNLEQAGRAGERLAGITQAVSNITAMNTQIAAAAEEQSAVAEEMNRNISNISAAATRTTTGARQLADAERELDQLVVKLRGIVGRFAV